MFLISRSHVLIITYSRRNRPALQRPVRKASNISKLKLALNLLREEDEAAAVEMVNAATLEAVVVAVAAAEGTTLNSNSSKALTLEIPTPSHRLLKRTLNREKRREKSIPPVVHPAVCHYRARRRRVFEDMRYRNLLFISI